MIDPLPTMSFLIIWSTQVPKFPLSRNRTLHMCKIKPYFIPVFVCVYVCKRHNTSVHMPMHRGWCRIHRRCSISISYALINEKADVYITDIYVQKREVVPSGIPDLSMRECSYAKGCFMNVQATIQIGFPWLQACPGLIPESSGFIPVKTPLLWGLSVANLFHRYENRKPEQFPERRDQCLLLDLYSILLKMVSSFMFLLSFITFCHTLNSVILSSDGMFFRFKDNVSFLSFPGATTLSNYTKQGTQ